MARWARSDQTTQLPQFPGIQDSEGNVQDTNTKKAEALALHFFPAPRQVDLQDIQDTEYPRPFWIDTLATPHEVGSLLRRLPVRKAAGPDKIPNLLLKECREILSPLLAQFFTRCMQIGHHPRPFKHSITVVLKKPQKPDYTKPGAYRPIALLNTLAKTLEALVAKRISREAEQRGLLPELEGPNVTAMGFVDDSNILTWGMTTEGNCRALERAHQKCIQWADRHGAAFAPQKYQLIHFTRSRKIQNLNASVRIQGFQGQPVTLEPSKEGGGEGGKEGRRPGERKEP